MGGQTCLACVDGPEFDGHQVDWDLLLARLRSFFDEERQAVKMWEDKI